MERIISLVKYGEELNKHNWNYKQEENSNKWREGHKNFLRLSELSYQSREHRNLFEEYLRRREYDRI